jgi:hypothetical protein
MTTGTRDYLAVTQKKTALELARLDYDGDPFGWAQKSMPSRQPMCSTTWGTAVQPFKTTNTASAGRPCPRRDR